MARNLHQFVSRSLLQYNKIKLGKRECGWLARVLIFDIKSVF